MNSALYDEWSAWKAFGMFLVVVLIPAVGVCLVGLAYWAGNRIEFEPRVLHDNERVNTALRTGAVVACVCVAGAAIIGSYWLYYKAAHTLMAHCSMTTNLGWVLIVGLMSALASWALWSAVKTRFDIDVDYTRLARWVVHFPAGVLVALIVITFLTTGWSRIHEYTAPMTSF